MQYWVEEENELYPINQPVDFMLFFNYIKQNEPVSKCFSLFKVKEGENFSRRNTLSISRIKI